MSIFKGTPEQYVDLVSQGIHERFKADLKKRLEKLAAEIVEEVAEKCAASMTERVSAYHDLGAGDVRLNVQFNYTGEKPT